MPSPILARYSARKERGLFECAGPPDSDSVIESGRSGRTGLPAAVNPQPLVRILPHGALDRRLDALGVFGQIARQIERRVELQAVAPFGFDPEGEAGDYRGDNFRRRASLDQSFLL